MPKAVFLVPGSHDDAYQFQDVGKYCRKKYWGEGNAIVFKANLVPGNDPTFSVVGGVPYGFSVNFWKSLEAAEQFILISHYGLKDGPIVGPGGQQPWPSVPYDYDEGTEGRGVELTEDAKAFWRRASWAVGSDGKFLLAGCDSAKLYGRMVSKIVSLKVFGFAQNIGSARRDVADKYIGGQFLHGATGKNIVRC